MCHPIFWLSDATFLAAGPGVAHGHVEEISSITIAARIAAALGIEPPRQAQRLPLTSATGIR